MLTTCSCIQVVRNGNRILGPWWLMLDMRSNWESQCGSDLIFLPAQKGVHLGGDPLIGVDLLYMGGVAAFEMGTIEFSVPESVNCKGVSQAGEPLKSEHIYRKGFILDKNQWVER